MGAGRGEGVGCTLVVDGMNVIGARPDGWWRDRDAAVRRLAAALALLSADQGRAVVLVLDGRPLPDLPERAHDSRFGAARLPGQAVGGPNPGRLLDGVEVRYARRTGADAADDRIVDLVREDPDVEVVTSDRRLRDRVTALGARVSGVGALWAGLDDAGRP